MNKSPAFQFYPSDYLSDMRVRLLSWAERGLYMDLLCFCWREGFIPASPEIIQTMTGFPDLNGIKSCMKLFQEHSKDPSKLIHKRLVKERVKQESFRKERSESGKRGAQKRWLSHSSAIAQPVNQNSSAIKEPLAKNSSSSSSSSSSSEDSPSENPKSITYAPAKPTLGELIHFANSAGYDKDEAETWWHDREATGWTYYHGPIQSWRSALTAHMRKFEAKQLAKQNRASKASRNKPSLPPSSPVVPLSEAEEYHDSGDEPPSLLSDLEALRKKHAAEAENDYAVEVADE